MSAAIVDRLRALRRDLAVTRRDLAETSVSHLSGACLAGQNPDMRHDQAMQEEIALGGAVLDEFLAADIVVIGAPLDDFTVPRRLKSLIDRMLVAGRTFRYTEQGAVGLARGRRVIRALSRNGLYGADTPHAGSEHGESLLRAAFGFIRLPDAETIVAAGVAQGPEQRQAVLDGALGRARLLADAV